MHPEYDEAKYEQEKNQKIWDDLMTMCKKVHGIGSKEALKALKQWSEVYRARKGLFSSDMVWQAAKDADPVT